MRVTTLFALMCLSFAGFSADWTIETGKVHFTSVKNGAAPVSGHIKVTGVIEEDQVKAVADLNSTDTGNPLRDPNLKQHLFQTGSFPKMEITGSVPPRLIPKKVGASAYAEMETIVHYRGLKAEMKLPLRVIRTDKNHLRMYTVDTVFVTLESLGLLGKPLETLMKICAHESVLPVVFLSFDASWKKQ